MKRRPAAMMQLIRACLRAKIWVRQRWISGASDVVGDGRELGAVDVGMAGSVGGWLFRILLFLRLIRVRLALAPRRVCRGRTFPLSVRVVTGRS